MFHHHCDNDLKQVAGAGFGGPLLIYLLYLTHNKKLSSHSLQFLLKYHVFLYLLRAQIRDHTHHNSGPVAIYYTIVESEKIQHIGLEKM